MKWTAAILLLILANPATGAGLTFEQARANSNRDEASLSPEKTGESGATIGHVMGDILPACLLSIPRPGGHPDLTPFTVIVELDAKGKVARSWRRGQTPLALCFHRKFEKATLYAPPRVPFWTGVTLALTEGDVGNLGNNGDVPR